VCALSDLYRLHPDGVYIYRYKYTYVHTHIYVYIYICIYTHAPTPTHTRICLHLDSALVCLLKSRLGLCGVICSVQVGVVLFLVYK